MLSAQPAAALSELRRAARSRSVHAEFLAWLIAWAEDGCLDDSEPNPDDFEGITFDQGVALVLDVRAIFLGERVVHPLAYPALRAAEKQSPRPRPASLYEMMEARGII